MGALRPAPFRDASGSLSRKGRRGRGASKGANGESGSQLLLSSAFRRFATTTQATPKPNYLIGGLDLFVCRFEPLVCGFEPLVLVETRFEGS